MARPIFWTPEKKNEIISEILDRISEGESVRFILKDEDKPSFKTFLEWVEEDEQLRKQYARAMEIRADAIFEEMFDIADDGTNDYYTVDLGDDLTTTKLDAEHIQRSKLRIDTRKWALSKMQPKKYGDKIDVTTDGEKITQPDPLLMLKEYVNLNREARESNKPTDR